MIRIIGVILAGSLFFAQWPFALWVMTQPEWPMLAASVFGLAHLVPGLVWWAVSGRMGEQ
jgi:hypothetical protein